jgi:hypothetical protein
MLDDVWVSGFGQDLVIQPVRACECVGELLPVSVRESVVELVRE